MIKEIDWQNVRKILIVRLRSIGDTVLTTPSLIALRRFLPDVQIDILLEDWVAPVLDGFEVVDNVLTVSKTTTDRLKIARRIRKEKYDVAFNLHGGTTAGFFVRATGAKHRVGYQSYQYSFLYNHLLSSPTEFWQKDKTHSAEQQLALLGFVGIPVKDSPKTNLAVTKKALKSINSALSTQHPAPSTLDCRFALLHPVAAFNTKQWATENFAEIVGFLSEKGFQVVAVGTQKEKGILNELKKLSKAPVLTFEDLILPEITALASKSDLFVGNDSGIAHIATAVKTPSVVIFGSSNRDHWCPWTDARNEIVYEEFSCQPCAGYVCKEFDEPKCILSVRVQSVIGAIERVLL